MRNTGIYIDINMETGQTYIQTTDNEDPVSIGELVAVAKYGVELVEKNSIHYYNLTKWDNRPENIGLVKNKMYNKIDIKSYWKMVDGEPQLHYHDGTIEELAEKHT